jgi:hypothetical protein
VRKAQNRSNSVQEFLTFCYSEATLINQISKFQEDKIKVFKKKEERQDQIIPTIKSGKQPSNISRRKQTQNFIT